MDEESKIVFCKQVAARNGLHISSVILQEEVSEKEFLKDTVEINEVPTKHIKEVYAKPVIEKDRDLTKYVYDRIIGEKLKLTKNSEIIDAINEEIHSLEQKYETSIMLDVARTSKMGILYKYFICGRNYVIYLPSFNLGLYSATRLRVYGMIKNSILSLD